MKGISPFIAYALVILLSVTAIAIAVTVLMPFLNRAHDSIVVNEALNNMNALDSAIKEVASEGVGSITKVQLHITGGEITALSTYNNTLFYDYQLSSNMLPQKEFTTQQSTWVLTCQYQGGTNLELRLHYNNILVVSNGNGISGRNVEVCVQKTGMSNGQPVVSVTSC